MSTTLTLARAHALSAYTAAYLALALGEGLALATLDKRLAQAAQAYGIEHLVPHSILIFHPPIPMQSEASF